VVGPLALHDGGAEGPRRIHRASGDGYCGEVRHHDGRAVGTQVEAAITLRQQMPRILVSSAATKRSKYGVEWLQLAQQLKTILESNCPMFMFHALQQCAYITGAN